MFASKKEARRYQELKLLELGKVIKGLVCQPRFLLVVNGIKVGSYRPDFGYIEKDLSVVEDVKSSATKTEAYSLRVKLFKACHHDIVFREIL